MKAHIAVAAAENSMMALASALGSPQKNNPEEADDNINNGDDPWDLDDDLGMEPQDHQDHDGDLTGGAQEMFEVFKQLQAREEADKKQEVDDIDDVQALRAGAHGIPDQEQFFQLIDDSDDEDGGSNVQPPHLNTHGFIESNTLSGIMDNFVGCTSLDAVMPHLWHFACKLREHADSHVLPRPWKLRGRLGKDGLDEGKGKKLNWQEVLEHEAALLRLHCGVSAKRTSRMAAWAALSSNMAEQTALPTVETLEIGSVVLLLPPRPNPQWRVACVMPLVFPICHYLSIFCASFLFSYGT